MLLRILTFFKWVYGNPLTFLVGIRRIPAYHVDYTTAFIHTVAMLPNVHLKKESLKKIRVFIIIQNIYDAPASLPQSYVDFFKPEYL